MITAPNLRRNPTLWHPQRDSNHGRRWLSIGIWNDLHVSDVVQQAISWAEDVWERRIHDSRALRGGWTSTVLRLTSSDGERAVLRLMTKEPWRTHAAALLRRESETQRDLSRTAVPAPETLALDLDGSRAGAPAHLMTFLPGSLELTRTTETVLSAVARLLVDIHAHDPGARRPRAYQSWAPPEKRVVPAWAGSPALWRHAFETLEDRPPAFDGTFLHRDFHLGNILWEGDRVSGVVDWVETSWGPVALDVAHAMTYVAMLHGLGAAARFGSLYDELAPGRPQTSGRKYWQILDIVGYLPDPSKVTRPWRELGIEITDELARRRLEEHLAAVLG